MKTLNRLELIGRVGKDPEVRHFDNGSVANFSIATDESYKNKQGEVVERTEWHNVVAKFSKQVEIIEKYVKKGMLIRVEGPVITRSWEKDGQKNFIKELILKDFILLPSKDESPPITTEQTTTSNNESEIDDMPF